LRLGRCWAWLVGACRHKPFVQELIDYSKFASLAVIAFLAPWLWIPLAHERAAELFADRDWVQLGFFTVSFVLATGALVATPFLKQWHLRLALAFVFLVSFGVDYLCRKILGIHVIANMQALLWTERSRPGPLLAYMHHIAPVLGATIICGLIWTWPPAGRRTLKGHFALLPFLALFLAAFTVNRDFAKTDQLPSTVNLVAQQFALMMGGTNAQLLEGDFGGRERTPVDYPGTPKPLYRNIVIIVDESVRGDYLSLNNPKINTTPFLASRSADLISFGISVSSTNCSGPSRFVMRTGLQPFQIPDIGRVSTQLPTIWQYARLAGLRTIHIDPFKAPARPFSSLMNSTEAAFIDDDRAVIFDNSEEPQLDNLVAKMFTKALESPRPKFLFVQKKGTHAPYAQNLPREFSYELSRQETEFVDKHNPANHKDVRDYLYAIRWRVDHFFEQVLPQIARPDTLTIYTSDHGQTMYGQDRPFPHCNVKALPGEGWVPLFVFGPKDEFTDSLRLTAKNATGAASHFEIFPTLLLAMGYDPKWVREHYGPSLLEAGAANPNRFYSPFIFGGKFSLWFEAGLQR
jgi:glucan phosphoethanolaminetransferase (alkaline phosphatase superfamily)